ncbi:hypothetical protein COU57_06595 [Candidatus Pacearchaeota archaeon CG10_big_fil_rev_8_21_14_0_10_32_14]|nr:MAG: hypothetical protein COU57_06595 [Candidatus Pacearchaeota archaeon CG10_big_fil_rev_8_21_14_0_10_32_14]
MKEKHEVFYRLLYNMVGDTLHPLAQARNEGRTNHRIDEPDPHVDFLKKLDGRVNEHYPHLWEDLGIMGIANYVTEFHPESERLLR